MGTDLDSLLEAGASAGVTDIDNIMSLIRAHAHRNGNGNGNGNTNGNGSAPAPQAAPAEKPQTPATIGEAMKAHAQFNHELMSALRILGEAFVVLQGQFAQLQEHQRAGAEQTQRMQERLTSAQSHSAAVEQGLAELKQEVAQVGRELANQSESSRRQRYEQARQIAQLEERVSQIHSVVAVTARRLDGVASRAYGAEQSLEGMREHVENGLVDMRELHQEVSRLEARTLEQEQRLGRVAEEINQHWGEELSQRETIYREQFASLKAGLESLGTWFNQEVNTAKDHWQSELGALRELVSTQARANEAMTAQIQTDLSGRVGTLEQKVEALGTERTNTREQYDHRFDGLTMRLLRAERAVAEGAPQTDEHHVTPETRPELTAPGTTNRPMDYFMFSLQHRGSVASVRSRQAAYAELFHGRKQVLDLGCGRGEFLELISGNGTRAIGVDSNRDMIDFSREHGLDVVHADLFEYLQSVPDTGVDGIFSAQVIEHLSPDQIRMLIHLCGQKLAPDGLLVLETVNPLCPLALTNFWLDPTHVRPVLPKLLTFMLEEAGFNLKALRFNSPVDGSTAAPSLETVAEWPAALDQYQDYAAIANKSGRQ